MIDKYDHKKIEKKWQKKWEETDLYAVSDKEKGKHNKYVLTEFAYPSGNLHVGHWYAFSVPDIYARKLRMGGENVLYPVGFDAFGLPAENAAIKKNINPKVWTEENITYMTKQLKTMGTSFDWSREVRTNDPKYYKWTQWMFIQLLRHGLAEQKETEVNWCSSCKTVLANEQVINNKCERCDSEVIKKQLLQWNLKITKYAERLLADLDGLNWPEEIKEAQRNWIGKSDGVLLKFPVAGTEFSVDVFTTRVDTVRGVTFLVLAPEHHVLIDLEDKIDNFDEVSIYVKEAFKKTDIERGKEGREKSGIRLQGLVATNPYTGEEIPLFVADYVLAKYGTGAIMAVPSHDKRDEEFRSKFKLPIGSDQLTDIDEVIRKTGSENVTMYKLRDWTVSRQRYWGVPIPIVHCASCGAVSVNEEDLPIILPEVEDYLPSADGRSPLSKIDSWLNTKCPKCSKPAKRETDTLDTFVDSSWYFLRYTDPRNDNEFANIDKQANWMPVNLYSGGAEHTTMHLLYSRFWQKALFDMGLVSDSEPYIRRLNRGLILGPDGNKMSKSKGNVIDPDEIVERLGADTVRMYLAFIGPYSEVGSYPWNPDSIAGVRRFLERVWNLQARVHDEEIDSVHRRLLHKTIKKVGEDIEKFTFNTAISALMILLNSYEKERRIPHKEYTTLLALLAPFAPFMTEEIWHQLGHTYSIHNESWPEYDPDLVKDERITIAIMVNGKTRSVFEADIGLGDEEIKKLALEDKKIKKWLAEKEPKKVIYISGKVVSIVT